MYYYWIWLAAASITLFILYGFDKARAKNRGRRVPEKTLHWLALLGGFPGGWLGRSVFHHKTRKAVFTIVLVLATLLHAGFIYWVWFR